MRHSKATRCRRGVATVEAGLLLPLLLLIILGAIDFGRFAYAYIGVTNAARTGAAFGCMNPFTTATQAHWTSSVRERVLADMGALVSADSQFGPTYLTVNATRATDPLGMWRVRVEVSYPFQTLIPWPGIPHNVIMKRAVEMRGIR